MSGNTRSCPLFGGGKTRQYSPSFASPEAKQSSWTKFVPTLIESRHDNLLVAKALGRRQQPYHAGEILFIGDDRFFNEGLGSTVIGRRNLLGEISDTFVDSGRGSLASPTFLWKTGGHRQEDE